MRYPNLF